MGHAGAQFWPWWIGGAAVALFAVVYPIITGRLLGVSSFYSRALELIGRQRPDAPAGAVESLDELERALLAETEAEFGPLPADDAPAAELSCALAEAVGPSRDGRPLFLAGMVLGGLAAHLVSGAPLQIASLGSYFDQRFRSIGLGGALVALLLSGLLIGFGTRMAGGCTSGHGISGVARGEPGSLISTATFWGVGVAVTWLIFLLSR